jgi:hypothetical protein
MVIQKLEQKPLAMIKAPIPINATLGSSDPHTFIFLSENALTTTDKLMVLIPGSQVPIGQWSRRVMCDENINDGSMITVCEKAFSQGYEVIITNPNANYWSANQSWVSARRSQFLSTPSANPSNTRLNEQDPIASSFLKAILPRLISNMFSTTISNPRLPPELSLWVKAGLVICLKSR